MSAELGRKRVSQTDPLQQASQGRALCGLGTAEAPFGRGSRRLQIAAVGFFASAKGAASEPISNCFALHSVCASSLEESRKCDMPDHSQFNIDRNHPGVW